MKEEPTFGEWLKRQRRRLNFTQRTLAHRMNCSISTVRKIEGDERRPSLQLATLLAAALNIPPEQHDAFIGFARAEPYSSTVVIPLLSPLETEPIPDSAASQSRIDVIENNLPLETTPFIGREAELAMLEELFADNFLRLVTIQGPGGMGKTRLALAYAHQLSTGHHLPLVDAGVNEPDRYRDGIFFIDLAPLTEPEQLIFALAETLGVFIKSEGSAALTPSQQLLNFLRDKRMLLLFDNFEHLLPSYDVHANTSGLNAAEFVAEILQSAPEVRIVVTSRESLNLSGEQNFAIRGLPVFEKRSDEHEERGEYAPAVWLFLQTARRIQSNFVLEDQTEHDQVVEICRLLEGLPLALELAASGVDMLSLEEIAVELQHGLDLLQRERRDVPERYRSVRATFDYSWRTLNEKEQAVFPKLSIFRGGFTRPAVQKVTGVSLHVLSRLVHKSLITFNKKRGRFEIHELLRQYGAEKLERDGQLKRKMLDRHSRHYCQAMAVYNERLKGEEQAQTVVAIERDIENVRLAWKQAVANSDFKAITQSQEALREFYQFKGWFLQIVNDLEFAVAMYKSNTLTKERRINLGQLLTWQSFAYGLVGDQNRSQALLTESIDILRSARESMALARALEDQGASYSNQGLYSKAQSFLKEALAIVRKAQDDRRTAGVLSNLGLMSSEMGNYEKADQHLVEGLSLMRKAGDISGISWLLTCLAFVTKERGFYEQAEQLGRDSLTMAAQVKNRVAVLFAANSLARALLVQKKFDEAQLLWEDNAVLAREMNFPGQVDYALFMLGNVALMKGEFKLARQLVQESASDLQNSNEEDSILSLIEYHGAMGKIELAESNPAQARHHFQTALKKANKRGAKPLILDCLINMAELALESGQNLECARLAEVVTGDPASWAETRARGEQLLARLNDSVGTADK